MKDVPHPTKTNAQSKDELTAKETYNIVSDTVVGVNVRAKDNLIQGSIILVTVIIGLAIGHMYGGFLMLGGLGGLIIGFLVSGIFLMIYRPIYFMKKIAEGTVLILIGIAFGSLITFFGCLGMRGKDGTSGSGVEIAETVAHIFEISLTSLGFLSIITMAVSLSIAALIYIKSGGETSLHLADNKKNAQLLITKGANLNARNDDGETPLDWAIKRKDIAIASLLRKHGGKTGEELKAEGK